jgi:hypothetical protein
MLYIIQCEVIEYRYMNDDNRFNKTHLVEAESEEQARTKLRNHYDNKCGSYWVNIIDCSETIK